MPVEIRELVIRATVSDGARSSAHAGEREAPQPSPGVDQPALIDECVRQVLKLLRQQRER